MRILNLTQHVATPEQVAAGVVEPADKAAVQKLLMFDALPTWAEVSARAKQLARMAVGYDAAMIGGAPYLMASLEAELVRLQVPPVYSFSERISVDTPQPDGSVRKVATFRHAGFVEVSL